MHIQYRRAYLLVPGPQAVDSFDGPLPQLWPSSQIEIRLRHEAHERWIHIPTNVADAHTLTCCCRVELRGKIKHRDSQEMAVPPLGKRVGREQHGGCLFEKNLRCTCKSRYNRMCVDKLPLSRFWQQNISSTACVDTAESPRM